jgi:AraC family transcriptional regulator, melibiose operon regulatory protein
MKAYMDVDVQYEVNGLRILRETRDSTSQPMPHSHNEIEILLLERGSGSWLLGGELVTLKPGRLIVFWAVRPHQLIKSSPNTVINCLTIPLTVFNEWQLPERLSKALLAGQTILESDLDMFAADKRAFGHWSEDLHSPDRNRHKVALLEIEARLGRLAGRLPELDLGATAAATATGLLNHQYFQKVSQIAEYVSKHFSEPLTVPDIARAVNMHPTSATKMFKKICGINLIHYLTQHRILHAQRLLMTSDLKILDIALASGYRSASRFYAAYKKFCGMSPQRFRASVDIRKMPLERKNGVWRTGKVRQTAATGAEN